MPTPKVHPAEPTNVVETLQKIISICKDEGMHYDDLEAREEILIVASKALGLPYPFEDGGYDDDYD